MAWVGVAPFGGILLAAYYLLEECAGRMCWKNVGDEPIQAVTFSSSTAAEAEHEGKRMVDAKLT